MVLPGLLVLLCVLAGVCPSVVLLPLSCMFVTANSMVGCSLVSQLSQAGTEFIVPLVGCWCGFCST